MKTIQCKVCGKTPSEISEYIDRAEEEQMSPEDYVVQEEGTFNPVTGKFYCKTDFRKTLVLIDGREFREGRQCERIYYVPATSEHDYGRYFVIFNKRVRHEVPVSSVLFLETERFEVADADSDEEFIGRTD